MADPEKLSVISTPISKELAKTPEGAATTKQVQVPPGFKIVKVRKPDGTIIRVKRPIEPTQAPAEKKPTETTAKDAANMPDDPASTTAKKDETEASSDISATGAAAALAPKATFTSTSIPAPKTAPSQKSAPAAVPKRPRHRSSRPFFSAFATRAVTALIPDVGDIGELMDGDEILDDGNDSDYFDDDDGHDSHDNNNDNHHGGHLQLESNAAMPGAKELAAGFSAQQHQPPAYARMQNGTALNKAKSDVQVSEKEHPQVNEKEIGDDIKPGDPETRSLHKSFSDWTRYIIWFIMISFPILYIVLGIMTSVLPTKEHGGSFGTALAQATKISVSAWPIIFAAIAAQSLRTIAAYKVERGVRLMTLEQLMGSNSVASSIKQPFLLRRFDLVTIALLILWSLSPLATQALQRMSFDDQQDTISSTTVWYLDTWTHNVEFNNQSSEYSQSVVGYGNIIRQFFEASTIPPAQDQAVYQDPWGRPKIPIMTLLDNSTVDSEGWIDTSTATVMADFSSNYGIPLQQPQVYNAAYNFNISSSYLDFSCSPFAKLHPADFNQTDNLTAGVDITNRGTYTTYLKIIPQNETSSGRVIFASFITSDESTESYNPETQDVYAYSTCTFTQTFLDSQISCDSTQPSTSNTSSSDYTPGNSACFATAVRHTAPKPPNTPMGDFTGAFMDTAGSVLDSYLYDPVNVAGLFNNNVSTSIMNVSTADFSRRLGLLVNTYWQLGFGPTVQDSGLNHETAASVYTYTVHEVPAEVDSTRTVYAVSWGWIAALFVCSGILLIAGVASMIMDSRTIVPDMLGFASSLARKSKYVDLPKVNSSMSGAERARLLGDHRVMMQDVKPEAPVGRVALGSAHAKAKRLEKGRPYR